jgi:hypothetical protein
MQAFFLPVRSRWNKTNDSLLSQQSNPAPTYSYEVSKQDIHEGLLSINGYRSGPLEERLLQEKIYGQWLFN